MSKINRRDFIATGAALWATALIPVVVRAEPAAPILEETDAIAVALG